MMETMTRDMRIHKVQCNHIVAHSMQCCILLATAWMKLQTSKKMKESKRQAEMDEFIGRANKAAFWSLSEA